ncbi:MAG: 3-deoxy-D-manno-octulosonic acid transferase [Nitrospinales bacterium]
MLVLYHIIVHAAFLAASPFILARAIFDAAFREDILKRLQGGAAAPAASGCLWLHAASAGEVRAAGILWRALKDHQPGRSLALSTFTSAGYELAKKEGLDPVFRLPPDSPLWINPLLEKLDPALLILVEAEFWPCLLGGCKRRGVPVILVNGRMSPRAVDRYAKFKSVFRQLTAPLSIFSMRTSADAQRVLDLGIAEERVRVTGNIKFDALIPESAGRGDAPLADDAAMVVFGSTRPGDEGPVMEAVSRLQKEIPGSTFVLAPRHIERCEEVERLIGDYGLTCVRHSRINGEGSRRPVIILLDTIGDLNAYYRHSCVAFVGGGFNPRFGGHNIIEPAIYDQPVVYGKHMTNFEEEAELLAASGGGIQIDGPGELYPVLLRLLQNPEERVRRGRSAGQAVKNNRGAVQRNLELIDNLL